MCNKRCNLCLVEKYFIILKPDLSSLNKRNELLSSCRHRRKYLLSNYNANWWSIWLWSFTPDFSSISNYVIYCTYVTCCTYVKYCTYIIDMIIDMIITSWSITNRWSMCSKFDMISMWIVSEEWGSVCSQALTKQYCKTCSIKPCGIFIIF